MNQMKWILLAAVLLIVACTEAKQSRKSKPRPRCPVVTPTKCEFFAPPVDGCSKKKPCPKGSLCCLDECGYKNCAKPGVKQGKCPVRDPNIAIKCAGNPPNLCENDAGCKGKQKCCKLYCANECYDPVPKVKPGRCPTAPTDLITTCLASCTGDGSCPKSQKCCHWGCGIKCLEPVSSKKCPAAPPYDADFCMRARVASDCSPDVACTGGKGCCPSDCGSSRCQDLV